MMQLDYDTCRELTHAAGTDAGNRSMRKAGRKVWNVDDYNAAVREQVRIDLVLVQGKGNA